MVLQTGRPPKSNNNLTTISNNKPCPPTGMSCTKCNKRKCLENRVKGTLLDAFRKAVSALDELDLVPRTKKKCKHRPIALTIYVRKRTEKGYNAIRLSRKSVEELKLSLGDKYNFPAGLVTSLKLSTGAVSRKRTPRLACITGLIEEQSCIHTKGRHIRICKDITEETVEAFEDEDDFLLDLSYDNLTGRCDITLTKGTDATTQETEKS